MQTVRQRSLRGGGSLNPGGTYWIWYILPALLVYTLFMAYPMIDSVRLSLYEGTTGSRTFVGLDNYVKLFTDPVISARFWGAFKNTWVFFAYHMLLQNVLGMLPGVGNKLKNAEIDDDAMKKPEAIIQSMTPRERRNPDVLNASRRKRIAAGAGVTVQDVNQLMRQFDQMRKMMKQMMGNKRGLARGMRNFPGMM